MDKNMSKSIRKAGKHHFWDKFGLSSLEEKRISDLKRFPSDTRQFLIILQNRLVELNYRELYLKLRPHLPPAPYS